MGCMLALNWQPVPKEVQCHGCAVTSGVFLSVRVGAQCLHESAGAAGRLLLASGRRETDCPVMWLRAEDTFGHMMKGHSQHWRYYNCYYNCICVFVINSLKGGHFTLRLFSNPSEQLKRTSYIYYCWKVFNQEDFFLLDSILIVLLEQCVR